VTLKPGDSTFGDFAPTETRHAGLSILDLAEIGKHWQSPAGGAVRDEGASLLQGRAELQKAYREAPGKGLIPGAESVPVSCVRSK
jgi:hypothetical protein